MTVEFKFKKGDRVRLLPGHGSCFADAGDTGEVIFGSADLSGHVSYVVKLDHPRVEDARDAICRQTGLERIGHKLPNVPFKAVCILASGAEAEDEFSERKLYDVIPQPDGLFRIKGAHGNWWADVYEEGKMLHIDFGMLDFAYFLPVEE